MQKEQYFQPLIIAANEEEWVHPEIAEWVELDEEGCNYNVFQIYINLPEDDFVGLVVVSSHLEDMFETRYTEERREEIQRDVAGLCGYLLTSEDWSPGGENWLESDFGSMVAEKLKSESWEFGVNQNIVLFVNEDGEFDFDHTE